MYEMKMIDNKSEITSSQIFAINHYQWKNQCQPKAYGRMALLRDEGIYVTMTCEESDPKRDCKEDQMHICQDSVMEAFFAFTKAGQDPSNEDMYINYEMNANGKLYAKYGFGRKNRKFISAEQHQASACTAKIEAGFWTVSVLIPKQLLEMIGWWEEIVAGETFYCNFYKMSENPEIEHYGSYHPLISETPNFHLPRCFDRARRMNVDV